MERKMIVRKYKETDCRETAALFYETVHNVNRRDYSRRQCEAWAPEKRNLTAWNERFLRHFSFVAVEDEKLAVLAILMTTGTLTGCLCIKIISGGKRPRPFAGNWKMPLLLSVFPLMLQSPPVRFLKNGAIGY